MLTPNLWRLARQAARAVRLAGRKFLDMDGEQRAAAFAYNAFFALFPMILLTVSVISLRFDKAAAAGAVISAVEKYIPLSGHMQAYVFDTVAQVIKARGEAGLLAVLMLVWAAGQFFTTITQATNRAWGTSARNWWHGPLKDLFLLGVMLLASLVGVAVPLLAKMARGLLERFFYLPWAYSLWTYFVPWATLFLGLSLFYMLAPRRKTVFAEVWPAALAATALLYGAQNLFVYYLSHSSALNAVYGTFGAIIALMLWIYLSGAIFIFGACLAAAGAAVAEGK
jgi:YihY family inner membrane protein